MIEKELTSDEIDMLEAGAGLDALVAEHVLGWRYVDGEEPYWHVPDRKYPFDTADWPFAYSTDIGVAWQVVEHLRSQDWEMTLSVNHYVTAPWDCRLFLMLPTRPDAPSERVIAHGKRAPVAICKAALKAVLEKGNVG